MSDRLTELRRQRALLHEHLEWLDREIARESAAAGSSSPRAAKPASATPSPAPLKKASFPNEDLLLEQYQSSGASIHSEVKRGCMIYFFAAFALLAIGVIAFYLVWRH
ncbi:MAG TPA: hypothetical protein VHN79_13510 [Lacunisphaera sp.]|nr:hypothetical protein [Lacunisphaera sp.]